MGFLHLNVYLCVFLPWPTLGLQTSFPLFPAPPSIPVPFRYHCLDFYFPSWMQLPTTNLPCAAISLPLSLFFRSLQTHKLSGSNIVSSQFENRVIFLRRSPCAGERDGLVDVLAPSAPSWLKIELVLPIGADWGPGNHQVYWLQRHLFPVRVHETPRMACGGAGGGECLWGSWPSIWEQACTRGFPWEGEWVITPNDRPAGAPEWECDNGTKLGVHSNPSFSPFVLYLISPGKKKKDIDDDELGDILTQPWRWGRSLMLPSDGGD